MKLSYPKLKNFINRNKNRLQNVQLLLMVVLPILLYYATNANYSIMVTILFVLMALVMLVAVIVN
mgnify:CR=1 FL=1